MLRTMLFLLTCILCRHRHTLPPHLGGVDASHKGAPITEVSHVIST